MKTDNKNCSGFSLIDLIAVILAIVIPLASLSAKLIIGNNKAKEARCIGSMKQIGLGLDMWYNITEAYPPPDISFMSENKRIASWPEMLLLGGPFNAANIEKNRERLTGIGTPPEHFVKVIGDPTIFLCFSDHPHPHKMNEERARAEGYWLEKTKDGYPYSYAISMAAIKKQSGNEKGELVNEFHKDVSSQILASDGVWTSAYNFSAAYITDPKSKYDEDGDWCNRVGYFHGSKNRAVVVMRDDSVKNVDYGEKGEKVNPKEAFFYGPKEKLTVHH